MISIVYITYRQSCKFEWFIDSLLQQVEEGMRDKIQIIIVDGILNAGENSSRREYFESYIPSYIDFIHVPPKPTAWQGPYRLTEEDYFAAANTRNTGACYAKHPYIAFVDDLGVLGKNWLSAVFDGASKNKIYCGAYTKVRNIEVLDGKMVGGDTSGGVDHRLHIYSSTISECPGGHMYGSSFSLPLCWFFEVNGQNEMCEGLGGEDYDFGIRLSRLGKKLYYNKDMFIFESNEQFDTDRSRVCVRKDPCINDSDFNAVLKTHGIPDITGRRDMSHFMLAYSQYGPVRANPLFSIEQYNTQICHFKVHPTDVFIKPAKDSVHFFTGRPISQGL